MSILIVGGGSVGNGLAEALQDRGEEVVLIEKMRSRAGELSSRMPKVTVIHGDGDEPIILEEARISHATAVAAVTDQDEDNLIVCLLARREYGVGRTIARVNEPSNAWLFGERFGVDEAFPAGSADPVDLAGRLARRP